MLDAIYTARELRSGMTVDVYVSAMARGQRRGVERWVEITSEASRHLPRELTDAFPGIPWLRIRDVGNVIRHAHSSVDDQMIWRIATQHLDEPESVLQVMLAGLAPDVDC
ncbi:MAG TPA: DUF86 domain-containing protein [Hyphomicrobiaceae bacterium]|nr:DUF86 domain-containing protein [Hyphomicrobiaceae bacterium]